MAKTTRKMEIIIGAKDKTKAVFRKIGNGFKSLTRMGAKLGVGIAAGVGVASAALVSLTKRVLESTDGLAKTADKLGVTTEELSSLRHAAQLAGMDIKEMDKSLQFMLRNIAEAADGMAAQKDAFDALGLSIDNIQKMAPGDAMQEIVRALGGIENQSKKVQIAMDIFGRSGASMLNLTADGLEKARKEAEMFGIAISRQDAKTFENINDSLTRIKAAISGAAITLVKQFAPTLEAVGAKLVDWSKSGKLSEWAKELGRLLIEAIPRGLILILELSSKALQVFRGWGMLVTELKIQWLSFQEALWGGLAKARTGMTSLFESLNVGGIFDKQIAESKRIGEEQRLILSQIARDKEDALRKQQESIKGYEKEQSEIEQIKNNVDKFVKSIDQGTTSVDSQTASVNKLANAYESAAKSAQKLRTLSTPGSSTGQTVFGDPGYIAEIERQEGE